MCSKTGRWKAVKVDRGSLPPCPSAQLQTRSPLLPESFSTWGRSFSTQLAFNGPDAQSQGSAVKLLKQLPGAGVASHVWNVSAFPLTSPPPIPPSLPIRDPGNLVTFHNGRESSFSLGIRDFEISKGVNYGYRSSYASNICFGPVCESLLLCSNTNQTKYQFIPPFFVSLFPPSYSSIFYLDI